MTIQIQAILWATVAGLQGPSGKPPFLPATEGIQWVDKEPSSAFSILMIVFGVAMLAGLMMAAFLALSKLGAMQESLRQGQAANAKALERLATILEERGGEATGPGGSSIPLLESLLDAARTNGERADQRLDSIREALHSQNSGESAATTASKATAESERHVASFEGAALRIESTLQQTHAATAATVAAAVKALEEGIAAMVATATERQSHGSRLADAASAGAAASPRASLLERIDDRLTAMGYGSISLVTSLDDVDVEQLVEGGSAEIVVEARRGGTVHKGRVTVESGRVADVQLRPSHQIFP